MNTMKTLNKLRTLFLMTLVISLYSCQTDDDGRDGGAAASGSLIAVVDGDDYESQLIGTSVTRINVEGTTTININANRTAAGSNRVFSITMIGIDSEGIYDVGGGANISRTALYIEASATNPSDANTQTWQASFDTNITGQMNISEITDTRIQGTFSLTAPYENTSRISTKNYRYIPK